MIVLLQWIQIQNFDSYYNSFTAFYQGIRGIKLLQKHHYFCKNTTMRKNCFNSVRGGDRPHRPLWIRHWCWRISTVTHHEKHRGIDRGFGNEAVKINDE